MTSAAKKVLNDALALTEDERRKVAERLLDTIPRESADEIERLWNEEALRRARAVEEGRAPLVDGEDSIGALEEKLRSLHRR